MQNTQNLCVAKSQILFLSSASVSLCVARLQLHVKGLTYLIEP